MGLLRDALKSGLGQSQNSFSSQESWGNQQDALLPPPVRAPSRSPSRSPYDHSTDESHKYSLGYIADTQQNASYLAFQRNPATQRYEQPYYNAPYRSQSGLLQRPTQPGPLQRPFALPQSGAGSSFLRGFSEDLARAGVSQHGFINFVDQLNITLIPNPEMQLAGTAAGLAGWFVPGLAAGIALTAVQVGAQVGGSLQTKGATKSCLETANRDLFAPHGMEVMLKSTQQLNELVGLPGQTQQPLPLDPSSRLQIYSPYIATISFTLAPAELGGRSDPLAQLGSKLSNRKQEKQQRKAVEDAAKGKTKKMDKLESLSMWLVVVNSERGALGAESASGRAGW